MYLRRVTDNAIILTLDCGCRITMELGEADGLAHIMHHGTCPSHARTAVTLDWPKFKRLAQEEFDLDMGEAVGG